MCFIEIMRTCSVYIIWVCIKTNHPQRPAATCSFASLIFNVPSGPSSTSASALMQKRSSKFHHQISGRLLSKNSLPGSIRPAHMGKQQILLLPSHPQTKTTPFVGYWLHLVILPHCQPSTINNHSELLINHYIINY